jgi:CRISPR/Cas system-associated exonuclease Cas4 (RecB family)
VTAQLLACLAALAVAVAVGTWWTHRRQALRDLAWLRRELAGVRPAFAERVFRSREPALAARIDRGYVKDDRIWLVELKTRDEPRVHPSDVIELSAQRIAVESETNMRVAETGFVLTQSSEGSRRLHRVKLIGRAAIDDLLRRRAAILEGSEQPRFARSRRLCRDCAYRVECGRGRDREV